MQHRGEGSTENEERTEDAKSHAVPVEGTAGKFNPGSAARLRNEEAAAIRSSPNLRKLEQQQEDHSQKEEEARLINEQRIRLDQRSAG